MMAVIAHVSEAKIHGTKCLRLDEQGLQFRIKDEAWVHVWGTQYVELAGSVTYRPVDDLLIGRKCPTTYHNSNRCSCAY